MTNIADLIQLIYASQPFGYDAATLSGILLDARRCNERDGVSGALVCRHDIFLQLLEGPEVEVQAAFTRIGRDDRHVNVKQLVSRTVSTRMFGNWDMLHDPAKSWIWPREEILDGVLDRVSEADVVKVFEDLSEKVQADTSA